MSLHEGLSNAQVPRSGLALVEQRCTAKFGGGLRNLQRNKGLPIKRSPITRVLSTDRQDEIEGSMPSITLREVSDYKRSSSGELVQAPLCRTLLVIPGGSQEDASVVAGSRCMPGQDSLERHQPAAGGSVMGAVKHNVTFVSNTQVVT